MFNAISTSGSNLADLLYHQNSNGKYEFFGLRLYKTYEDEGCIIAEIDSIDDLINNLQKTKKDIEEYNKMGS